MSAPSIKTREQLLAHLDLLQEKEKFYRERLVDDATELLSFIKDPATTIKRTVKTLANDGEFRSDLLMLGVNYLSGYLGEKFKGGIQLPGWINTLISKIGGHKKSGE